MLLYCFFICYIHICFRYDCRTHLLLDYHQCHDTFYILFGTRYLVFFLLGVGLVKFFSRIIDCFFICFCKLYVIILHMLFQKCHILQIIQQSFFDRFFIGLAV